jgi:hypothetical protein
MRTAALVAAVVLLVLQCAQPGEVLLSDDFSGSAIDQWVPIWGDWKLRDGQLVQDDSTRPAFVASASELWYDYALELRAMRPDDAQDGFLIGVRLPGRSDAIEWTIGGWCDSLTALQRRSGFPTLYSSRYEETARPDTIGTGHWYRLRVEVRGTSIKCWLDDILSVDYSHPDFAELSPSRVYLGSWRNRVCFDDVMVTGLR